MLFDGQMHFTGAGWPNVARPLADLYRPASIFQATFILIFLPNA